MVLLWRLVVNRYLPKLVGRERRIVPRGDKNAGYRPEWRKQLELRRIIAELEEERDRLDQAITLLKELDHTATARKVVTNGKVSRRSRTRGLTTAGRKRLSELMKRRWAERKRKAKAS